MKLFRLGEEIATTITNVNTRTEKHGEEERVAAVDVGLQAKDVPSSTCAILFGLESDEGLRMAFWDEAGRVTAKQVAAIPTAAKFDDGYDIAIGGRKERVDRVKKFRLTPTGGHTFEVTCLCQISEPSDGLIEHAVEHWAEGYVDIRLDPLPDLFERLQREAAGVEPESEQQGLELGAVDLVA